MESETKVIVFQLVASLHRLLRGNTRTWILNLARSLIWSFYPFAQIVELHKQVVDGLCQIVDFIFKFLDVSVSFVISRRVLIVASVEFFVELVLCLLDFAVDIFYDQVHVLSLSNLTQNISLELKHGLLDDPVIEVHHIRGDLWAKLWILIHNRL